MRLASAKHHLRGDIVEHFDDLRAERRYFQKLKVDNKRLGPYFGAPFIGMKETASQETETSGRDGGQQARRVRVV